MSRMSIDDETARKVFETYANYVYRTAFFLTGVKQLADDITQETFIKVFRSYGSYNPNKPMKPWIYKIAVNVTRTTLKRLSRKQTVPIDVENLPSLESIEESLLSREEDLMIWTALNEITYKSREVLTLRYFNDLTLQEISESLSIPLGTCKSRLHEAMSQLRKHLPDDVVKEYEGGDIIEES